LCAVASFTANVVHGFSISAVTLSPSNVVPPMTELNMTIDITTPSQGTWLYAPTQISSNTTGLRVDVYPTSGPLTAIGSLRETVSLGVFSPGTHNYEVVIHPNFQVNWGTRTNRGSFTVTGANSRPVVSLALVDGQAAETRIDQNAIFWAEFRVVRSGPTVDELVVFLNTQQGSARLGEDYWLDRVTNGSTVRIPPGTNAVNVRLYPIDDDFYEGDETTFFHLIAPPPGSSTYEIDLAHSSVEMVIHDNDPVMTRLDITAPRNGQHFEAGEVIQLSAQIIGPGSSNSWTVEFFDGNQRIGSTQAGGSIWWNNAIGGEHVINARATSSNGATLEARPVNISVGPGPAWPVVRIHAPSWRTAEPCPVCLVAPGVLTISRTGPTSNSLTVYLEYDGTATSGSDYQALPQQVTIPAGTNETEFLVLPFDDQLVEGPEIVRARIALPELATRGYIASHYASEAMVVIHDGEPGAPEIRLDIVEPEEGAQFAAGATIEVSALGVWTQGEVDQPVRFFASNVFIGQSNPPQLGRPTIPGLPSVHTIFWTNPPPGGHTLTARFERSPGLAVTSPPVNITVGGEPPMPVVSIEATQPIAEESSMPFRRMNLIGVFTISRTGPTNHSLPVFVHYSGTATPGVDYPHLPFFVSIPAGASSTKIEVVPDNDGVPEGIETVVATLSHCPPDTDPPMGMPCFVGAEIDPARGQATVFIRDDGITEASLTITNPKEGENFDIGETILIEAVAIDLHGYISRVEFWDGETQIGVSEIHFVRAPDPGTPIYHSFEWHGAAPGSHVLTARAMRANGGVLTSPPVNITVGPEPPLPIIAFEAFTVEATEPTSDGAFVPLVPIKRTGASSDLLLHFQISGTATEGTDYLDLPRQFLYPAAAVGLGLYINVLPDQIREPDETVVIRLVQPESGNSGYRIDPQRDTVVVAIHDSPPLPVPIVSIDAIRAETTEPSSILPPESAPGLFRITRSAPFEQELEVYVTYRGTAKSGEDYLPLPGTVVIPAGSNSLDLQVVARRDLLAEGDETVEAQLDRDFFLFSPRYLVNPDHALDRVVIHDRTPAMPHISITRPANGAEFPPDTAIEIVAETRDPDGYVRKMEFLADGRKIGEVSMEFIVPPDPGQTQTFTFTWRQPLPGTHALTARATDDSGATGTSAPVEIRVAASEPVPIVTVTSPDSFATEPSSNSALNTATFRIRRHGPTNGGLVVAYSLHGTAANGSDYETLSGITTIPAGSRSVTLTVRPLADNLSEGTETVRLRLEGSPLMGPMIQYRIGRPHTAVAVIRDRPWWPLQGEAHCVALPDGLRHVCFAADAGANFRIEASSDLRTWETLFDTVSGDGTWHFIDTEGVPTRFYRLTPEPLEEIIEQP
jgi:hypothetical protein